jgi:hypothetical protein
MHLHEPFVLSTIHPDHSFRTPLNDLGVGTISDRKMRTKNLIPLPLGVFLLCLSITSVYADPYYGGSSVAVGDQYSVTTLNGFAQAWIDGRLVTGPANLQLQVQVIYVGPYNLVFRVLSGTFQVAYKDYRIDVGAWRGYYSLQSRYSVYQGPATAPNGGLGYFTLYGQDGSPSNGGVLMNLHSDFTGEYDALWHVSLTAIRYQAA